MLHIVIGSTVGQTKRSYFLNSWLDFSITTIADLVIEWKGVQQISGFTQHNNVDNEQKAAGPKIANGINLDHSNWRRIEHCIYKWFEIFDRSWRSSRSKLLGYLENC